MSIALNSQPYDSTIQNATNIEKVQKAYFRYQDKLCRFFFKKERIEEESEVLEKMLRVWI